MGAHQGILSSVTTLFPLLCVDRIVRGWAWWKDHQSETAGKSDGRQEGSSGHGEGWVDTGSVSEVELVGLDCRLVVGCDDKGGIDFFWPQRPGGLC